MRKLVLATLLAFLGSVIGCTRVPNPCQKYSQEDFPDITYAFGTNDEFVKIGPDDQRVLAEILTTPPSSMCRPSKNPFGYLKIDGEMYKIQVTIEYFSGDGDHGLEWYDERIFEISNRLRGLSH